jgi:hypothetical protein
VILFQPASQAKPHAACERARGLPPEAKGVIPILPGTSPELLSGGGKRGADFPQKSSCSAEDPLHGLRPLRIGLPAGLPWRARGKGHAALSGRMYQRRSLRLQLPGERHTDEVGAPEWQPLHRTMASTRFGAAPAPTECSLNLRLRELNWVCGRRTTDPATGTVSPRLFRRSAKAHGQGRSATARC